MKKPERFVGYVEYDQKEIPFEYDESRYELRMYPSKEQYDDFNSPQAFFKIFESAEEHKWISIKWIQGRLSDNKNIIFGVRETQGNYQGFISHEVSWYYLYNDGSSTDMISGVKFEGDTIDYFYSPTKAIEAKLKFAPERTSVNKISVNSIETEEESMGIFHQRDELDVTASITAYCNFKMDNYTDPISAQSAIYADYSTAGSLDDVFSTCFVINQLLEFVSYRKNVAIKDAYTFIRNENGKRNICGILHFCNDVLTERNTKKARKRIIRYKYMDGDSCGKLLTCLNQKLLKLDYVCESVDESHHYSSSRMIMILAEFEREFRNIYGQEANRSEEFHNVKALALSLFDELINNSHGKQKSYVKELKKHLDNHDSSYSSNVKFAMMKYIDCLTPFIRRHYEGSVEDNIDGISSRIGTMRNGIAHNKLDFDFAPIHLSDIKIIEELLYIMRLIDVGVKEENCKHIINELFDENIGLA